MKGPQIAKVRRIKRMEKQLSRFFEVVQNPYDYLANWKQSTKRKIIGIYPMNLPEELVHAAGMLPATMWRDENPVTEGDAHLTIYNCALSRTVVDDIVRGKLPFLDGIVIHLTCLQSRGIAYIIERKTSLPLYERLYLPAIPTSPLAKEFLVHSFGKMKNSLEKLSGQKITAESLENSIRIYNRDRALLRKLYQLRRRKPGILKAKEVSAIVQSSMLMPKEEHSQLLEELLPELEKREIPKGERKRLILVGCLCQTPHNAILDLIEDAGGCFVDDYTYVGYQYFANDVELGGDPLHSLADLYLKRDPVFLTKSSWEANWSEDVIKMAKANNADGVIYYVMMYCPPLMMYVPDLYDELEKAKIPELVLEIEHDIPSIEKVKTEVTAFMEMLKGG